AKRQSQFPDRQQANETAERANSHPRNLVSRRGRVSHGTLNALPFWQGRASMKRRQAKPSVRAGLRRLFRPSCEALEEIVAPNDFGVFRALSPLGGWLDNLSSDVRVVAPTQTQEPDTHDQI